MKPLHQLLIICGPTSTGKTGLALKIAKKFDGEIVSADSRQVYKKLDIGTGKDLPKNSKLYFPVSGLRKEKIGCYSLDGVKIWGYDIADPKNEFSVSHYLKFARKVINDIVSRDKLPILVGGTGLYIKGVVDGIESAGVPKNNKLRRVLGKKGVADLFEMLANLNPVKAASLNRSDRKNPRRLVRAIEIAEFKLTGAKTNNQSNKKPANYDTLFIGLKTPFSDLEKIISERVKKRIDAGIKDEIKKLLKTGISWKMQSMNTLGYKEWIGFFIGEKTEKEVFSEWVMDEKRYAKRQMTWFKKEKRINWFDTSTSNWQKNIEKLVQKWHNEVHA